jgi:hypothetical protein
MVAGGGFLESNATVFKNGRTDYMGGVTGQKDSKGNDQRQSKGM